MTDEALEQGHGDEVRPASAVGRVSGQESSAVGRVSGQESSAVGRVSGQESVELRASHEDRDRVVELLQTAAGDGRLTAEELDERLEAALTARTHSELVVLTADLPAVPGAGVISGPVPEAKDLVRIDCRSGSVKRDGGWVVPQRIQVKVTSGNVKLDFTQAVISQSALHIDAEVRSGNLTLVTKPGIAVDSDEVAIRSGDVRVRQPWGAHVPVTLRITVSGTVGSGSLKARPQYRTFWQWLLRRPRPYETGAALIKR